MSTLTPSWVALLFDIGFKPAIACYYRFSCLWGSSKAHETLYQMQTQIRPRKSRWTIDLLIFHDTFEQIRYPMMTITRHSIPRPQNIPHPHVHPCKHHMNHPTMPLGTYAAPDAVLLHPSPDLSYDTYHRRPSPTTTGLNTTQPLTSPTGTVVKLSDGTAPV